ncbi:MAG TPA: hypothetical protein VFN25_11600, partial [Dokdonella sp.]|uniref:hypothetical protein n=1 Tax=Dokdonella sp. TaxID=2291710 RepID=UPI002D7E2248
MRLPLRLCLWLAVIVLAGIAAWRVVVGGMSDRLAADEPQQALAWQSNNPDALLGLARKQLEHDGPDAAAQTARRLLSVEPLRGEGFAILAEAAQAKGETSQAERLRAISLRRAPRDLNARAWLAGEQLAQGHYSEGLTSIDKILRLAPDQSSQLFPLLIKLAERPEFADALATELARKPAWGNGLINALLANTESEASGHVLSALLRKEGLSNADFGKWIDRLASHGAWGEAYARWAGKIVLGKDRRLANVYNGGFETAPSGIGFDWRMASSAGVIVERSAGAGVSGHSAVKVTFLGRRVQTIPLSQWLMLGPGTYRLHFRAQAQDLRSDRGIQWNILCQGSGAELVASERLNGSFDWIDEEVEFKVP